MDINNIICSDLVRANINDLIDKAENPEKMVKQIIIDMEEQLRKATQGLGKFSFFSACLITEPSILNSEVEFLSIGISIWSLV